MADANTDPRIVNFMQLFSRPKERADGQPDSLRDGVAHDPELMSLCLSFSDAASELHPSRNDRLLFIGNVDPNFIVSWREYEERYSQTVSAIYLSHAFDLNLKGFPSTSRVNRQELRKRAHAGAAEEARNVGAVFEFAEGIDTEHLDEDFVESLQSGLATWQCLRKGLLFDLEGMMRRRAYSPRFCPCPGVRLVWKRENQPFDKSSGGAG